MVIATVFLMLASLSFQAIQAQGNNNINPNNDISKTIEQSASNQINNAFSNTLPGPNNLALQSNNNNLNTQENNAFSNTLPGPNNLALQSNNNNLNTQENNVIGKNFLISGPLSSFLSTPSSGNWVVNGSWILKIQNGNLLLFNADMVWDPTNISKSTHTHNFVNFRPDSNFQNNIVLGPKNTLDIKGIMDIGAGNPQTGTKIQWVNVPANINTAGNTITISILDDSKTDNHFGNYPIFGKIGSVEKCSDNGGFGPNMDYDPSIKKCSL